MCDVCRMQFHDPGCPYDDGRRAGKGRPIGECVVCESFIYQGDECFVNGRVMVCDECAGEIDAECLVDLCELHGREELLLTLGFWRCDEF